MSEDRSLPFRLQPIRKIEIFRSALDQLSNLVEQMEPGDRLGSERELAEQLGVSRVTIREVLRTLEGMGKVDIRRNSGTFVAEPVPHTLLSLTPPKHVDEAHVQQLSEVRAGIECQVVRLLATQDPLDLTHAEAALERAGKELAAASEQGSLDPSFEAGLARATGNPVLVEFQQAIHELWLHAWITLGGAIANRSHLHHEHLAILDALKRRQTEEAERLMRRHITGLGEQGRRS
ncbi:FadR family transcriptional regulator [Streptomyces bathyalis]|uniref:FadR family transcriptional regulator n=1 Tax=Streptomyces bathyalis TaxID=2710756 RepID=A0A7T1T2J3_9ACTN|nr:FCD domain-containing protein [Streptomyces bathyalis]QPP05219.1 FadR family transcriptional regulator [Streptomyces bathyalis]